MGWHARRWASLTGTPTSFNRSVMDVCRRSWKRISGKPALLRSRLKDFNRLCGFLGVPMMVGKIRSFSCQRDPATSFSCSWRWRCSSSLARVCRRRERTRFPVSVLGGVLGDETLQEIVRELVKMVRNNVTIDWIEKESVCAKLWVKVERTLLTHKSSHTH